MNVELRASPATGGDDAPRRATGPAVTTRCAIVIPSKGRPAVLTETVRSLARLEPRPRDVIVAVTEEADVEPEVRDEPGVRVVVGPAGISKQRNGALAFVDDACEAVLFLDDDIELAADYVAAGLAFLDAFPHVVAFSGRLLAEEGIDRDAAARICESPDAVPAPAADPVFRDRGRHWVLHGCNMMVRAAALGYERFDERLPLYSYAEDYELSLRLKSLGGVGKFSGARAVHLRTPSGRVSGRRLGYAIVANNWYFLGKGLTHCRSLAAGYVRFWLLFAIATPLRSAVAGDFDRVRGSLEAVFDVLRGRSRPERILDL